ncbi:MAG: efflux RND transporter periplasmic adaptor subunit [Pseudomonadota bacterium]|jgi:cobalt-zinc-cadmium efflux system membrane fusion protein|uniref:Efflux RND transporter periplasmic adaptor subunit n=1 Tax=Phenylobacterium kunshanense TaxID=1445034 RepID=A0A328B6W9_9CAUL|nr:efflux RND transporter periplasmic adaptor subunit [Phenylobacterium kunshanense]RAK63140.1 efflux RND transporter periplasmic adaptor subunit [Phenylobacterium kunshanense]
MNTDKARLYGAVAAAVVLAGAGGYGLSTVLNKPAPAAAEDGHADENDGQAAAKGGESAKAEEGVVPLTPAQAQASGIQVAAVTRGGGAEVRLSGRVAPVIDAKASVSAVVGGRVERVLVAPGQSINAGQALAVLVSGDAASLRAEADAAQAAYVLAEQAHGRDEDLAKLGVVAKREAEVSHAQALSAQASARAARARASAAGGPNAAGRLNVTSPIAGVVTSVQVGPGGFVAQGGVVAEVTNPARVELVFNAPPQLAAQAQPGARMQVSGPGGEFSAVVTGVAADAGAQNSGATVIRAKPEGAALPPAGSPVTGALVTGQEQGGLSVPSEAVQTVEGKSVVFVQTQRGFRAVQVLAGRQAGGRTEILRGLTGEERVASTNAFLLKAEMAKGEAEHGH